MPQLACLIAFWRDLGCTVNKGHAQSVDSGPGCVAQGSSARARPETASLCARDRIWASFSFTSFSNVSIFILRSCRAKGSGHGEYGQLPGAAGARLGPQTPMISGPGTMSWPDACQIQRHPVKSDTSSPVFPSTTTRRHYRPPSPPHFLA